jgi:hypothetical protein
MKNEQLLLPHPVDDLKIYEPGAQKWDAEIFSVKDSVVTPYMPELSNLKVLAKDRVETLENGKSNFFFKLNHEVSGNDTWQLFFEPHRNGSNVTFQRDMLIICCEPQDLPVQFDEIYNAMMKATRDYTTERGILRWQVYRKMQKQEASDHAEAEILAEHQSFQQKLRERKQYAEENSFSVSILCQNLILNYREILENKFKWWSQILDAATISKYRALFEFDFLSI